MALLFGQVHDIIFVKLISKEVLDDEASRVNTRVKLDINDCKNEAARDLHFIASISIGYKIWRNGRLKSLENSVLDGRKLMIIRR